MEKIISFLNANSVIFGVPGTTIIAVVLILVATLIFRRFFSLVIIRYLRVLAAKTKTSLDDTLVSTLEKPLCAVIVLFGFVACRMILLPFINPGIDDILQSFLQFGLVIVLCWFFYRSADVFTGFLEKIALRTETELDDILVPYIRLLIKITSVVIVVLKAAELFLGMSAASLIGLLGGFGLAMGLVFKDIMSNWFGCGIIYIDNLFREGDWVQLDDGKIVDADVENIGIRSTKFRNFDNTVSIVPNNTIANSVVKNWSRMHKRRVKYSFRIDGILSEKLERILDGIRKILAADENVHQEFHMVNFREFEGNARIIRLYYFSKTTLWEKHELVRENINLKLLKLFEKEGVDRLAYSIVDLSDDRPGDFVIEKGFK